MPYRTNLSHRLPKNLRPQGESPFKEAMKLSLPIIASQLLASLGGFITSLMLSTVNQLSFATSLLTNLFHMIIITVVFGLIFSLSALIGRIIGEKEQQERVGQLFLAGVIIALLLSLPVMFVLYNIKHLLILAGQPVNVAELCGAYFRIYIWALPAIALISIYVQFLLGTFQQSIVFLYSLGSLILITMLSYLLIFGNLGLPAMGIMGIAWATVLSSWLLCLCLSLFIFRRHRNKPYFKFKPSAPRLTRAMRDIVKLGFPIAMQMGNEIGSFLITTLMVGWLGIIALEMQQIVVRYLMLLVIPLAGLSQAATVAISHQLGARNLEKIQHMGWFYVRLGLAYSMLVLIIFSAFPRFFISIFKEYSPSVAHEFKILTLLLIITAGGQIFDSIRNIMTGILRGLMDSKFPMLTSIAMMWIFGLPLAYFMGFTLKMGLVGMAIAHNIAIALGAGLLVIRFKKT